MATFLLVTALDKTQRDAFVAIGTTGVTATRRRVAYHRGSPRPRAMSDIFVSYVAEDALVAKAIADALEEEGYTAWYFTRDQVAGTDYLEVVFREINRSKALILIISPESVKSFQVSNEVANAYESGRILLPVLLNFTWEDVKKVKPGWKQALGTIVAVTMDPQRPSDIVRQLVAGLKARGLGPTETGDSPVTSRLPYPLAASYARHAMRGAAPEQAFQLHEGLRDLAETIVQYLAAIVVGRYRSDTASGQPQDPYIEQGLSGLSKPGFSTWAALLHTGLGLHAGSDHELLLSIRTFACEKTHRDDQVANAVVQAHHWLGRGGEARPPFAQEDLFSLLAAYADHPQGWGARGTVMAPEAYRQRAEAIVAALTQALTELGFLAEVPLLAVPDPTEGGGLLQANGTDVVAASQDGGRASGLSPGHAVLRPSTRGVPGPVVDLYPLFAARKCQACGRWIVARLSVSDRGVLGWLGPGCGHREDLSADELRDLDGFASGRGARPCGTDTSPYASALRELLAQGPISSEDRQKLDFLARMLKIGPDQAAAVEEGILREKEQAYLESVRRVLAAREATSEDRAAWAREADAGRLTAERAAALQESVRASLLRPYEDAVRAYYAKSDTAPEDRAGLDAQARELGLSRDRAAAIEERISQGLPKPRPPAAASHMELSHRADAPAPVRRVVVFGKPALVLSADDSGDVVVRDEGGQVVYRERTEGRPYCVAGAGSRAYLATWEGVLYGFDERELVWQSDLGSPVSTLAVAAQAQQVLAGTWAGSLRAFGPDGAVLWTCQLPDGIAAVAPGQKLTATATYAGQVAVLDATGRIQWLRELPAPVRALAFTANDADLIVIRRDHAVARLAVADQRTLWEQLLDVPFRASALSEDRHRLVVAGSDGISRVFAVNDGLHLRSQVPIPGLSRLVFSPLSAEGRFSVGAAGGKVLFVDNRGKTVTSEGESDDDNPVLDLACSADGRLVVAGRAKAVELYRLARPRLRVDLRPLGALHTGGYTRLEIKLANDGRRRACGIRIEIEGPVDCSASGLPETLNPGGTGTSVNQSLAPKASGAIPVVVKATYADDLDLTYEEQVRMVLDVDA